MNTDFIPGIFNYCDKCCDRCSFTRQCSIFVDEETFRREYEMSNDDLVSMITDKLRGLSELFDQRNTQIEILGVEIVRRPGLLPHDEEDIPVSIEDHGSLLAKSSEYARLATKWLSERSLDCYVSELYSKVRMGLQSEEDISGELDILQEWIDEIQRYVTFIPVKLRRAIYSARKLKRWERSNGFQNDCDGSAKIALIVIGRSMESWKKIMIRFPALEDACLQFLVLLEQLRESVLKEFPAAPAFIRPGFDEQGARF